MAAACCNEPGCRRTKPLLIRQGGFSHRWFLVTAYKTTGDHGQHIEAQQKHDIHDELLAALLDAGWTPPADDGADDHEEPHEPASSPR